MTPWVGDRPIARPLHAQENMAQENVRHRGY